MFAWLVKNLHYIKRYWVILRQESSEWLESSSIDSYLGMGFTIWSVDVALHDFAFFKDFKCKKRSLKGIGHFTVVCLVTWPWMQARLVLTLFWYRPHCFYYANQVVLMLTSFHLHEKNREVCIKARSTPASLPFRGQVTKPTTVKWSISLAYFRDSGKRNWVVLETPCRTPNLQSSKSLCLRFGWFSVGI